MNITEPFVLKRDILLVPCAELSEDVRDRMTFDEGDFTLSHGHGRTLAQVIDGETAALLALFREPRTIVEAVIENSRALGRDPRTRLEEMLPHFGTFVNDRVLVPAGSDEDREIRPQYERDDTIAGWKIVLCASLIEDSEIYQLRNGPDVAALKIARITTSGMRAMVENETAILGRLDGSGVAPRLLDSGIHDERPYLIIEWVSGVDAGVAASVRRHDRAALIGLCASIAAAYAELHARGVLHADVHPRNVLVGGEVKLLDFGFSRFTDQPPRIGRGGLYSFWEPEYKAGQRQGTRVPASSAGEQYSLAAMLYFLITGNHYLDFRFEREEMSRQIEEDPPLPFAARGVPPWPDVEQILFRALEKDPERRFGSIAEMAALLAAARDRAERESLATPVTPQANAFLEATLKSFAHGGEMFVAGYPAPRASINFGCAGAAVGLLRIAETRSDPALLALADVWRSRAVAVMGDEDAFYTTVKRQLPREQLGDVTPYHTESGIHAAGVLIAASMGDITAQRRALSAFLRASRRPCPQLDLTLGLSGSLLASAILLAVIDDLPETVSLRAFGTETMSAIWKELDARPRITDSPRDYTGMAHGWTGYLYAALRWRDASGDALPPGVIERLHEFAALRTAKGRGAYWRQRIQSERMVAGWCNGSGGQVFLFTLAHRLLGDAQWLELAELAAWNNWEEPCDMTSLCCGTAGRAYALLNLYKHTGAMEWLSRARQLANHAAAGEALQHDTTLWQGHLGVAALIADLASPENARVPFFE